MEEKVPELRSDMLKLSLSLLIVLDLLERDEEEEEREAEARAKTLEGRSGVFGGKSGEEASKRGLL